MGCDIHMTIERRVNGGAWERVEALPPRACSWCDGAGHYKGRPADKCYSCEGTGKTAKPYGDRNYDVFAVLADVRNGGNITPICEARGLPVDAAKREPDPDDEEDDAAYEHGDHSFSWLTLREVEAYDWKQPIQHEGLVDAENFKAWDEGGRGFPKEWSGGVGGGRVVHVSNSEMRRRIREPYGWEASDSPYTLVQWSAPVLASAKHFLAFVETLYALGSPDDVRLVFGFDS